MSKLAKSSKNSQIWPFSNLLDLENWPLEWFNRIHLLAVHSYPPWEASCINREKVIKQFLRKLHPSKKRAKFDLSDLSKWPLGWFNQIHIFTMHWYHPKEATCQKRKKVIRQFLRNQAFNWKVDDGRRRRTTTDESALEKLRCLSAGGAKKGILITGTIRNRGGGIKNYLVSGTVVAHFCGYI